MKGLKQIERHRLRVRLTGVGLLLAALFGVVTLQQFLDRQPAVESGKEELYFLSGRVLRKFCFGFEGLVANIYWTRAVQYYGQKKLSGGEDFSLLAPLLKMTTEIDPHLLIAYRFGAIFLAQKPPEGPGQPEEAFHLIRRGIVANPDYWRLWQDLGFIYYWDLKDYPKAAQAFEAGSRHPKAHDWMKVMAADLYAQGGNRRTSQFLWTQIYENAESSQIRSNAENHLLALKADEQIEELEQGLQAYAEKYRTFSGSWRSLVGRGFLKAEPKDPAGYPYVLKPGGKVVLLPESPVDLSLIR